MRDIVMLVVAELSSAHTAARKVRGKFLRTLHVSNLHEAAKASQKVKIDAVLLDCGTCCNQFVCGHEESCAEECIGQTRRVLPGVPIFLWADLDRLSASLPLVRRHKLAGALSRDMSPEEIWKSLRSNQTGQPPPSLARSGNA
jgi:hypothetical protein